MASVTIGPHIGGKTNSVNVQHRYYSQPSQNNHNHVYNQHVPTTFIPESNVNTVSRIQWTEPSLVPKAMVIDRKRTNSNHQSGPKRIVTSTYNGQRNHWWKVCWIYNSSHLLESARDKYSSIQRVHQRMMQTHQQQLQQQQQQSTDVTPRVPSLSSSTETRGTFATLPRDYRLPTNYNSNSGGDLHQCANVRPTNDQHYQQQQQQQLQLNCPEMVSNIFNDPLNGPSELTNRHRNESKSVTNLETNKHSFISFPSQLKLSDKMSLTKEMARFCSQQLNPSHLLQNRITQPLTMWAKSRTESNKATIANMMIQYKGANWRQQQLNYQMPIHDTELFRQSTAESRFIRTRQRKALVKSELFIGQHVNETCHKCKQHIHSSVPVVKMYLPEWSDTNGNNKCGSSSSSSSQIQVGQHYHLYHIDCFTCTECHHILVDLKAYLHPTYPNVTSSTNSGIANPIYGLFCSRHFVEIYKPRCPHCDQLILDEECTEAEGKAWHIGHFCCTECKRSLGGQQYIMACTEKKGSDHSTTTATSTTASKQLPYCLTCFDILFGELCEECGELIGCEVGAIIHEGRSWHATDRCFRCSLCLKTLLGKPFLPALDGRIYCSLTCSQAMISHQKERLRRQNKLQSLHSHQKKNSPQSNKIQENVETNIIKPSSSSNGSINEDRNQFLKSMTLNRYEQKLKNSQKDYEKIKILNLSQHVNYEQFIKQSNQYFTSKYDWSKEQEFVDIIDSSNERCGSQTTATTTSDHNSEDNCMALQLNAKCDLNTSDGTTNSSEQKSPQPPPTTINPLFNHHHQELSSYHPFRMLESGIRDSNLSLNHHHPRTTTNNNSSSIAQSTSSSQSNSEIAFQPFVDVNSIHINPTQAEVNSTYFFTEKTSSLNSPASNETIPSWATSPPPEYSKLEGEFKDESSSTNSSSQQQPQHQQTSKEKKTNGILKSKRFDQQTTNTKVAIESYPNDSIDKIKENVINGESTYPDYYYQSTPKVEVSTSTHYTPKTNQIETIVAKPVNEPTIASASKSVSFDPSIEDNGEKERRSIRRVRLRTRYPEEDCSDSHSCSSCSTCSSSSTDDDDDDDIDYQFDLTKYQPSLNCNKPSNGQIARRQQHTNTNINGGSVTNDACIIS